MSSPPALRASSLLTCAGGVAEVVADGIVAWEGDTLTYAGPAGGHDGPIGRTLEGCTIVPGFVDCHTHLPFFGWRDDEFEARLRGRSYRDLHGEGGGIPRSARMLAGASDDEVLAFCRPLLDEMLDHGTTTLEMKTGYGLSVEGELRQARLARTLAEEAIQTVTVTLLPCHTVPDGTDRKAWVTIVCDELIPAAASEGLADAVDVYVEDIAFTTDDLRRVAEAAAAAGLPVRCHADQLGPSGAAEAAVAVGARSADHLNHLSPEGVRALAGSQTTAVLLPASTLILRSQPPPAELIDSGAGLAIATDCNPGTSPVSSMPEAIALAGALYGLSPLDAVAAATAAPARVLGLDDRVGTLEPGKRADLLVLEGEHPRMIAYRPGHNPVKAVYAGGTAVIDQLGS